MNMFGKKEVNKDFEGDAFFTRIDSNVWEEKERVKKENKYYIKCPYIKIIKTKSI